ncbi:MAG: hypothetical protein A3A33_04350 [Candidatus Yanofskybacteria bacterium RIFCSPLOWO2_01_FULL_49_25]|uniref:D-alanine--D-alanine ligase n=1 Tax=Candidatus Yanofskybacteria bacterium RIFCSPLOWO2_01_FULL_49_25 TaxID=1802701 RepID=A0A1F8GWB4_9BACT|nr:MAG: hypothetical protein A3A33_04350 [Candidatus Yanofskybacteria bacterium RIFCSPLOWO2_01_FULL_49_25]
MAKKLTVAVLMGGRSSEHEVSLKTGGEILKHLDKGKYNGIPIVLDKDEELIWEKIKTPSPDLVFIALHGKWGEDGTIQGLLELAGIPYTGSGVLASALAMDKIRSMDLFQFHGFSVPEYISFTEHEFKDKLSDITRAIEQSLGLPCVVKPSDGGSSVGVSIVQEMKDLPVALATAFEFGETVVIQQFIRGEEATCGVLDLPAQAGTSVGPQALPPVHIVPLSQETAIISSSMNFFSYEAKYMPGGSDEIVPSDFEPEVIAELEQIALKAHDILGCSGYSRTDMMIRESDGEIFVLETNTLPGLTEASLFPKESKAAGISFPQLLDIIIQNALKKLSA